MVNQETIRKSCTNNYKREKAEQGFNTLDGFFKDVYEDILNGKLRVAYDSNTVLILLKEYKLNVETITTDNGRVWSVFKGGEIGITKPTLDEAVYSYVAAGE